jgi:hypothetical protein
MSNTSMKTLYIDLNIIYNPHSIRLLNNSLFDNNINYRVFIYIEEFPLSYAD